MSSKGRADSQSCPPHFSSIFIIFFGSRLPIPPLMHGGVLELLPLEWKEPLLVSEAATRRNPFWSIMLRYPYVGHICLYIGMLILRLSGLCLYRFLFNSCFLTEFDIFLTCQRHCEFRHLLEFQSPAFLSTNEV
jgi:hypothetical protein